MRLQKILELTNLSKKAIYFYIKEGLIHPMKNFENGYYDFSSEDLKTLQVITCLRKAGMSIQDIKELFSYPTLTNFFIHRQINNLKKSLYEQINQLQVAYYLIDEIPTNATPKNLEISLDLLSKQQFNNESVLDKHYPNVDSRMIAILIWAAFTDIETSEYHNFLWDKISNELNLQLDNKLINLKKLIYNLSPEQIHKTSLYQYNICREIAEADENKLAKYESIFYENCIEISQDHNLQNYWKVVYDPILIPTISFFNSKASILLNEYNPRYYNYNKNMKIIALNVLEKLKKEPAILDSLYNGLDYKFDPDNFNHAELISLYAFKVSIFTQLKFEDLKKLLG